jgi:hypothetical protein
MIKLFILSIFLFFSSCLTKPMQPEYQSKPTTPTPIPSVAEEVVEAPPASKEYNEVFFKETANRLKTKAANFGLKPLSGVSVGKDSLEMRFYVFPVSTGPLYKGFTVDEGVLILKRNNAVWSAEAVRQVNKTAKVEKVVEQFNAPKSGWDNLWQQLQNYDVLNPPADEKDGFEKVSWLYIIETKADGKYRYGYYHAPKKKGSTKEEQNFANIFSLLADEFNASDFKTN